MTDEKPPEGTEAPRSDLRNLVTSADLEAVDFEAPIGGLDIADAHEFRHVYERALSVALAAEDEAAKNVFRLFAEMCSMAMHASDPGHTWVPLFVLPDGTRSPIADDFRGEQTATLAAVVGRIVSPALRARIADIAWSNNRRDGASAAAAIDAYCDLVFGLLDGTLKASHGRSAVHEALSALERAMQIATASTKRTKRPEKVGRAFEALYAAARDRRDVSAFVDATNLAFVFGLREFAVAAKELEAVAAASPVGTYPLAVKKAWDLAARLYNKLNNEPARQRCLIAAVDQTLAMREQVKGSAAAEASWITQALQQLQH
jgi:hypothetical protein